MGDGRVQNYLVGVAEDVRDPIHEDLIPQQEAEERAEGGAFPVDT